MLRCTVLTLLLVATACGSSGAPPAGGPEDPGPPPPPPSAPTFQDGFESGLGLWTKDAHVPPSPGDPTVPVEWFIETRSPPDPVYEGAASAWFRLDGRQDDGTIWLERAFAVLPSADYAVRVNVAWWSQNESFNTTAMVATYAGSASPEEEADFLIADPLNEVAGWKRYDSTFDVTSAPDGSLWVAVGLSVVWETWITYYADDVRVWIEPR